MAKFVIHAGDFVEGNGLVRPVAKDPSFFGKLKGQFAWEILLPKGNGKAPPLAFGFGERLDISEFVKVEVADKESISRFAAGVGWGVAGSVLLGPLGV
jgi:hypothetical protein